MAKTREKNSVEHYKAIINRQRKMIKQLKKSAGRGDKIKAQYEDMELELAEQLLEEQVSNSLIQDNDDCKDCGKGKLEKIDLGIRKMIVCNNCSKRQVIK